MLVGVAGASGLAGRHVGDALERRGVAQVPLTRGHGVDLLTGDGLDRALEGVTVVIDASNVAPPSADITRHDAVVAAAQNLVAACERHGVRRLVLLSIINVDDAGFDAFAYYGTKRAQEAIVRASTTEHAIVRSAQWYEFATNPAAVTVDDGRLLVQDWRIQPLAAASVGTALVEAALAEEATDLTIAGPEAMALPELTRRWLDHLGDPRPVVARPAALPAFADGALLAADDTQILGPDLGAWLRTQEA